MSDIKDANNPSGLIDPGTTEANKQISTQIGAPFGQNNLELFGITTNPDSDSGTNIFQSMIGGEGYVSGINDFSTPSDRIIADAANMVASMGVKQNLLKDGMPISLNELHTSLGLADHWDRNRKALKAPTQRTLGAPTSILDELDAMGINVGNFGGDQALFDDFKVSLKALQDKMRTRGNLTAAISVGGLDENINVANRAAANTSFLKIKMRVPTSSKQAISERVFEIPIPNYRGSYTSGGSEAAARRFIGYGGAPKSATSLAISAALDYDKFVGLGFYSAYTGDVTKSFFSSDEMKEVGWHNLGLFRFADDGPDTPTLASKAGSIRALSTSFEAGSEVRQKLERIAAGYEHAVAMLGPSVTPVEFKGYLRAINISNVSPFYGLEESKPKYETVFHRIRGITGNAMKESFWTGASEVEMDIASPSSAYKYMMQADVLAAQALGMPTMAVRQTVTAMSKHAMKHGYTRIPGMVYSGQGVSNELAMEPSPFPIMNLAKRNQLAISEVQLLDETIQQYGSAIGFDPRLGNVGGKAPFLRLKTFHADPGLMKHIINTYMGEKYGNIAPIEDMGIFSRNMKKIKYGFSQSYNVLNTAGVPVRGVNGRNIIDSVTLFAADLIEEETGKQFTNTEKQLLIKSIGDKVVVGNLSVSTAIRSVAAGYGASPDSIAANAFARLNNALQEEAGGKASTMGFWGRPLKTTGKSPAYKAESRQVSFRKFYIDDIFLPGGEASGQMRIAGRDIKRFGIHSKLHGELKMTYGGEMAPGDIGLATSLHMAYQQKGLTKPEQWVPGALTREEFAAAKARAHLYSDVMAITAEGKVTGGLAKGVSDIDFAKDIIPDGGYQFTKISKATRLAEDVTSMVELLGEYTPHTKLPARVLKSLRELGYVVGPNGEIMATGGLREISQATPGTIMEIARAHSGFAGADFTNRRYIEAMYMEELLNVRGITGTPSKPDVMRLAGNILTDTEINSVIDNMTKALSQMDPSALERFASQRADFLQATLVQAQTVGLLPHAQELNNFMQSIGLGNLRNNLYNVKDESYGVHYTNTKTLGKKNLLYRAEKGLVSKAQEDAFNALQTSGHLPEELLEKIKYVFSGVGADRSALITGGEIANILKFNDVSEETKSFLANVAKSLDSGIGLGVTSDMGVDEAFEAFKARYKVTSGAKDNAMKMAMFMQEVMVHPNVDIREQISQQLFGGKTLLSGYREDYILGEGFGNIFSDFVARPKWKSLNFAFGGQQTPFHQAIATHPEFQAKYGHLIDQFGNLKVEGMSLFPEHFGFKLEKAQIGSGGAASYAAEDMQSTLRDTLSSLGGVLKRGGEYTAVKDAIDKNSFKQMLAYAYSAATSSSPDNKLEEALSEEFQTLMGKATVTDVRKQTQFSGMLDTGVSVFVDEAAAIKQMERANKSSIERGLGEIYSPEDIELFKQGKPIISTITRNPLNVGARLSTTQLFSGTAYGVNLEGMQRMAFYHGSGKSKEYYKAIAAYLNMDHDGDATEAVLANSPEMRKKLELSFEMQNRAMSKAIEIQQSPGHKLALQDVLDQIKGAVIAENTPKHLGEIHAAEAFFRIGTTGGRKKIKELEGISAQIQASEKFKKLVNEFDGRVGEITNVGNIMSTLAKSNAGVFHGAVHKATGLKLDETEIRVLWDVLNEQFLEAPANIKNYHDVSRLYELTEKLKDNYKALSNIEGLTAEATKDVFGKRFVNRKSKEWLDMMDTLRPGVQRKAIKEAFFSYADIVSHAMGPLEKSETETVQGQIRVAIAKSLKAGQGLDSLKQAIGQVIDNTPIEGLFKGTDAMYLMAELEEKKGWDITGDNKITNIILDAINRSQAQPALSNATVTAAINAPQVNAMLNGGTQVSQASATQTVRPTTKVGSTVSSAAPSPGTPVSKVAAEATQAATHSGGTLIDEFMSGSLENRLIKMLEANDSAAIKHMKVGGYIGAGLFGAFAVGSALYNNIAGHSNLENDDKGSSRAIATAARENKAYAEDSVHYSGPVRVTDNPGMYNYNTVSRSSGFRPMRGMSRADIINGAGNNSNVTIVNEVSRSDIDSATGDNYNKDSF